MMSFEEYLTSKNIDSAAFKAAEPEVWQQWATLFEQIHPNSFTEQKKFLLNTTRRRFLLNTPAPNAVVPAESIEPAAGAPAKPLPRKAPVIKRRTDQ
jgi:hypothetical protein